eukprot:m.35984 g.35984  ORF g.35984 m.35984 type:complete len:164 (+) comp14433_c0_seq12:163-654(+)
MATVAEGAIVCKDANLRGSVSVGAGTIVHPSAVVNGEAGPVVIGADCMIEELVEITGPATIGTGNVFEVGAICHAAQVGCNNVFEARCTVGDKVTVTDRCHVGIGVKITNEQTLDAGTVLYTQSDSFSVGHRVRKADELPSTFYTEQAAHLKVVLPKYHQLQR